MPGYDSILETTAIKIIVDDDGLQQKLKKITSEFKKAAKASEGAFTPGGSGSGRTKREVDQLTQQINALRNRSLALRNEYEAGLITQKEVVQQNKTLRQSALDLSRGLENTTKEYKDLLTVAGRSSRTIATAEGRLTKLGFSANANVAIVNSLQGQLAGLGPAGNVAAMGLMRAEPAIQGLGVAAGLAAGAVGGVTLAAAALVRRGLPQIEATQQAFNVLRASGVEDLNAVEGALRDLQDEGGRAAQTFSRSTLAGALADTVKAGVSSAEALDLLATSTQLAAAEGTDLNASTQLLLQNLRQFGLSSREAARAGDALAAAGLAAAGTAADLSEGLSTVGPVARAAGFSIEETLALLVELDNKGLSAAQEGATGLRSVLAALLKPTGDAKDLLDDLGVSLVSTTGKSRPLKEVLTELVEALQGDADAAQRAAEIFDTRALTAFLGLEGGAADLTATLVNSEGVLRDYADELGEGLAGSAARSKAALDDLAATFADFVAPAVESSATALSDFIRDLDALANRDFSTLPDLILRSPTFGLGFASEGQRDAILDAFARWGDLLGIGDGDTAPRPTNALAQFQDNTGMVFDPATGQMVPAGGAGGGGGDNADSDNSNAARTLARVLPTVADLFAEVAREGTIAQQRGAMFAGTPLAADADLASLRTRGRLYDRLLDELLSGNFSGAAPSAAQLEFVRDRPANLDRLATPVSLGIRPGVSVAGERTIPTPAAQALVAGEVGIPEPRVAALVANEVLIPVPKVFAQVAEAIDVRIRPLLQLVEEVPIPRPGAFSQLPDLVQVGGRRIPEGGGQVTPVVQPYALPISEVPIPIPGVSARNPFIPIPEVFAEVDAAAVRAAEEQRQAAEQFKNTVVNAGLSFADTLVDSIRSGDVGGLFTGATGFAGSILGAIPGLGLVGTLVGGIGGILGGLFGAPSGGTDGESRAVAATQRSVPNLRLEHNFYQTNNFAAGITDPQTQAALRDQARLGYESFESVLKRAIIPRLDRIDERLGL